MVYLLPFVNRSSLFVDISKYVNTQDKVKKLYVTIKHLFFIIEKNASFIPVGLIVDNVNTMVTVII